MTFDELVLTPPDVEPEPLGPPSDPNPMVRAFGVFSQTKTVRCKTCAFCYVVQPGQNHYFKCSWRKETRGPGSDHRINWNACAKYEKTLDSLWAQKRAKT